MPPTITRAPKARLAGPGFRENWRSYIVGIQVATAVTTKRTLDTPTRA